MDYQAAADMVFNEYAASVEKHGDWRDYTLDQMMSVIIHELMMEAGDAAGRGDITGPHGVIREISQVAACCHKLIVVLSERCQETLAETLRPIGAHSEGEGRALPASPSLHQGKESCSNHPKEVAT